MTFTLRHNINDTIRTTCLAIFCLLAAGSGVWGQFKVEPSAAETLIGQVFKGPGIKVRNVKYVGHPDAIGKFYNKAAQPGFPEGVIMSSGLAAQASGPNEDPKTSSALGALGDRKLDMVAKTRTFDAAIFEFEFMADKDSVAMRFIFASEEYAEHVGSTFADPIYITITGPGLGNGKNLAILPGTTNIPININSINITENKRWYVDNNPFTLAGKVNPTRKSELDQNVLNAFQFDGMTKPIEVGVKVTPREVYRCKIAVSDAGDGNFDSALLLGANSFVSLEQNWRLEAREQARIKAIADSLARAEAIQDSLDALATENMQLRPSDTVTTPDANEKEPVEVEEDPDGFEEVEAEETEEAEPVEEAEEVVEVEEEAEEEEEIEATEPADTVSAESPKQALTVIQFEEDSYFVPEDQEDVLREIATVLKANPTTQLGIYVPNAADPQVNDLRYDMVRLEIIKSGAKPAQVFRSGSSLSGGSGDPLPKHRAELLLQPKE